MLVIPKKLSGEIIIPNSLTEITENAFEGNTQITSLSIGSSVRTIGERAFYGCVGLTQITGGNALLEIGNYAFSGCSNLTSGKLTALKSVGNYAFSGCRKLVEFNFSEIQIIKSNAFYNCGLLEVNLPNSVTSIGSDAFAMCFKITSITLPFIGKFLGEESTNYPFGVIFGTSTFSGAIKTTQYYIKNGQTYASSETYYIPSSLKSITINGGNVNYGTMSNLVDVEIILNNVQNIENNGFLNAKITNLTLSNSLLNINGDNITGAFKDATINNVYYKGTIDEWLNVNTANKLSCLQYIAN